MELVIKAVRATLNHDGEATRRRLHLTPPV
jgi:hypothetical protein